MGTITALMTGLVSEDKGRDILTIYANPTQISVISEFQLVNWGKLLPQAEKVIERAETLAGITKRKIMGTACSWKTENWHHQLYTN